MNTYLSPCEKCEWDGQCCGKSRKYTRCEAWLKYYRTHQLWINNFAKKYGVKPTTEECNHD